MQNPTLEPNDVRSAVVGDRCTGLDRLSLIGTHARDSLVLLESEVDGAVRDRREPVMRDRREQEGMNETWSREINEWIDDSNESSAEVDPFGCTCNDGTCTPTFVLTHVEYEEIRSDGTYVAIATNHENPDLDVLVSQRVGFAIVRKLPGMPSRLAIAADPRR